MLGKRTFPGGVLLTGLMMGVISFCRSGGDSCSQEQLLDRLGPVRPVEGRLVGVKYAPLRVRSQHTEGQSYTIRVCLRVLNKKILRRPSAEVLRLTGLLKTVTGDLDGAIKLLQESATADNASPYAYSDLSAVLLARGASNLDPFDYILALNAAEKALSLDRSLREAVFNRSLALGKLYLLTKSKKSWYSYREIDSSSQWAVEASTRLLVVPKSGLTAWYSARRKLDRAIADGEVGNIESMIRQFPQAMRLYVEEDLLVNWAEARRLAKEDKTEKNIQAAKEISSALLRATGDSLLFEAVEEAQESVSASGLPEAHRIYGQAVKYYKKRNIKAAKSLFEKAHLIFMREGSSFQYMSMYYIAACLYFEKDYGHSLSLVNEMLQSEDLGSYYYLIGKVAWLAGVMHLEKASPDEANTYLFKALSCFKRSRDLANQGAILSLMGTSMEFLGEPRQAWKYRYEGVRLTISAGETSRLPVVFNGAARTLASEGFYNLGLLFQDEALVFDLATGDPIVLAEAFWWRSTILHQMGWEGQARKAAEVALNHSNGIADVGIREHAQAGILAVKGAAYRSSNPESSLNSLTQALSIYKKYGFSFQSAEIYLERAKSFLKLGMISSAEDDLEESIQQFELQRYRIESVESRVKHFDRALEAFEEMISLQLVHRRNALRALEFVERGRCRTLLDADLWLHSAQGRRIAPLQAAAIREKMPVQTILIEYLVLRDRTWVWLVTHDDIVVEKLDIGKKDLERLVGSLRLALLREDAASFSKNASILFDLLFSPLLTHLPSNWHVVVVPDKALHSLPFAALFDKNRKRFLVEDFVLAVAPSISAYLYAMSQSEPLPSWSVKALSMGNPKLESGIAKESIPTALPRAAEEAMFLQSLYPESLVVTEKEATLDNFLENLNSYEIIHYAGHAVQNSERPFLSKLLFSSSGNGKGILYMRDIYAMRLDRPRLVILSACETANGGVTDLEGISAFPTAFMVAGVPSIVASLWKTEDQSSEEMMQEFHVLLHEGGNPAVALRQAQITMIERGRKSGEFSLDWAAFVLNGGTGNALVV